MEFLSQFEGDDPEKGHTTSVVDGSKPMANDGKPDAKTKPYLDVPLQSAFARSSDDVSDISTYSADNENERREGRLLTVSAGTRLPSRSPTPPTTWKGRVEAFWTTNKGLALVMLAQLFGVMMSVTTRLLEMDSVHGPGMHPFQVVQISSYSVYSGSIQIYRSCLLE